MSRPIDDLKHEHQLIKRALTALESASSRLGAGGAVAPDLLDDAREFVRGFADACHHGKEEHALFPLLASKNETLKTGPVKMLTSEHEAGRELMRQLGDATEGMRDGREGAAAGAQRALELYTRMLRRHIEKEEEILFPLAEQHIASEDEADLMRRFDEVEERMGADAHERYETIVHRLEDALKSA
jgi:hemerythrin-like domain-containing protein